MVTVPGIKICQNIWNWWWRFSLNLKFSLLYTHTLTHALTHTLTHIYTHTHTHWHSHRLTHTHKHTHTHRHQALSLTLSPSLFVTKDMKMHNVNARNRFNGIFDLQIHSLGFSGSEVVSSFHRLCDNEAQTNEISLTISFYQNINFQTIIITLLRFFIIKICFFYG